MDSYETFQPFARNLWSPSIACYLFRRILIRSLCRCIRTDKGPARFCWVGHTLSCRRRLGGVPKFLEIPYESVPRAGDSGGS